MYLSTSAFQRTLLSSQIRRLRFRPQGLQKESKQGKVVPYMKKLLTSEPSQNGRQHMRTQDQQVLWRGTPLALEPLHDHRAVEAKGH